MMRVRWAAIAVLLATRGAAFTEDKQPEAPRVIAVAPFGVISGEQATLRIRGAKLSNATELRFDDAPAGLSAEIKEKKAAEIPTGLDAQAVGDTQIEVKLNVPADLHVRSVNFRVVTPDGTTAPRELRVLNATDCVEEIEPNGGLREAQPLALGQTLRGTIKEDKDVDTFRILGKAGQRLTADIVAAQGASFLDSLLTLYDGQGHPLASNDDHTLRDSHLVFQLPADGAYLLTVQDAHDRGSLWHTYLLSITEAP
ncbi:MAG: PPC domain-containing protein [Chthoniobacterales bacterium]